MCLAKRRYVGILLSRDENGNVGLKREERMKEMSWTGLRWHRIEGVSIPHRAASVGERIARSARNATLLFLCVAWPVAFAQTSASTPDDRAISALHQGFAHPPDDCKIMMRWWWFGPSVTKPELHRELEQMKAAGIGGVEIATLYPLALDDPTAGFQNDSFLSDRHIDLLRFAAEDARKLGLRVDVTLGSGWPFGGPHIPITQAAGELRVESVAAPPGADSIAVPALEAGEHFIAAFQVVGSEPGDHLNNAVRLPDLSGPRIALRAGNGSTVLFFIASRTGMMVKRPANGAEGFVLDHYDRSAIDNHLRQVGDRLLSAFGSQPPYAVFSDSLEDYGSDWTPDMLGEFQRRRGYDLTPWLPALIGDIGPETEAIRHDWGQTLTELANEHFLQPMQAWAHSHHTLLRSQTYGFPPVTLSSNRFEDLPEGEGKATIEMWRQFSDTRWAASAGHLFQHPVISSETWTWLHSPAFRATPLDMKAEADLHFLQGINQLVGHGWPYSPEAAGEPGWRMYAAGAWNAHNPWFAAMPDLTAYLQRVSFALRQGKPQNDVVLLLPNDDVWASFKTRRQQNKPPTSTGGFDETGSNITVDESMPGFLGTEIIPQILDAGFNLDFIDADAIETVGIPYKVLVLPGVNRIPPKTYEKILAFARQGGIVVATRRMPATAPGLTNATKDSAQIQQISLELFAGGISTAHFVAEESGLGESLARWIAPDFVTTRRMPAIGFIHRHLDSGDLYFIANTSNQRQNFEASFRSSGKNAEILDPFSGRVYGVHRASTISFDLYPYESRIILFTDQPVGPVRTSAPTEVGRTDLSRDWNVTFGDAGQALEIPALLSWSEIPRFRYFSGTVTYARTVDIPESAGAPGRSVTLDFGEGTPVPLPSPLPSSNMRAYLESPVREAAEVYVNEKFAGFVWHPPYRVDVSPFIKPGKNEFRIDVANTAINELAGRNLTNNRLLYDRYGVRFIPQGMDHLEPLPSGILGPLTLIESESAP